MVPILIPYLLPSGYESRGVRPSTDALKGESLGAEAISEDTDHSGPESSAHTALGGEHSELQQELRLL